MTPAEKWTEIKSLLAIDPGEDTGFALFQKYATGWELLSVLGASPDDEVRYAGADLVVIEKPRIYPNGKADPNDIITLALKAGRYQERYKHCQIRFVFPREWKGTINGDVMCRRIEASLSEYERGLFGAKIDHNALDAYGLGRWAIRQPWMREPRQPPTKKRR